MYTDNSEPAIRLGKAMECRHIACYAWFAASYSHTACILALLVIIMACVSVTFLVHPDTRVGSFRRSLFPDFVKAACRPVPFGLSSVSDTHSSIQVSRSQAGDETTFATCTMLCWYLGHHSQAAAMCENDGAP